jgi:hypothetical protein
VAQASPATREAIISRIGGKPVRLSEEFSAWATDTRVDIATSDFHVQLALELHSRSTERRNHVIVYAPEGLTADPTPHTAQLKPVPIPRGRQRRTVFQSILYSVTKVPFVVVKWIAILSGGGSNIERELVYLLENVWGRSFILGFTMIVWKICSKVKDFGSSGSSSTTALPWSRSRVWRPREPVARLTERIVVELTRSAITGFASVSDTTRCRCTYSGTLSVEPNVGDPLFVATYDSASRLTSRVDMTAAPRRSSEGNSSRRPSAAKSSTTVKSVGVYDKRGRVVGIHHSWGHQARLPVPL